MEITRTKSLQDFLEDDSTLTQKIGLEDIQDFTRTHQGGKRMITIQISSLIVGIIIGILLGVGISFYTIWKMEVKE